ncbi:MAG: hypothetical protein Kow00105_19140 [Phycisphaeraceae bacterium]
MPNSNYTQTVRTVSGIEAKRVAVNASSDAAVGNTLIAAVPGKRIALLAACLIAAGDVVATFYSGPADTGTVLTGPLALGSNGGFVINAPTDPVVAWLMTAPGEALTLHLASAVSVGGWLVYLEVEQA